MRRLGSSTIIALRRCTATALVLLAGCASLPPAHTPPPAVTADTTLSQGYALALQHCSSCHGVHLNQAIDERTPMRAVSFYVIAGNADWTGDRLRQQLDRLHPRMGIAALSDSERDALAIYILTLRNDMGIGG